MHSIIIAINVVEPLIAVLLLLLLPLNEHLYLLTVTHKRHKYHAVKYFWQTCANTSIWWKEEEKGYFYLQTTRKRQESSIAPAVTWGFSARHVSTCPSTEAFGVKKSLDTELLLPLDSCKIVKKLILVGSIT